MPLPPDPEMERKREIALEVWHETQAIMDGIALEYLMVRRGIPHFDADRVRWHARCPWGGRKVGCIVVPVTCHCTGCVTAIWRIRPVMKGKVERLGLGPVSGNAARLFPAYGPGLVIAEGVEDALAAHALTGAPAWAALSRGNMAALVLPERFRDVTVIADDDLDGGGLECAQTLVRRLRAEGRAAEAALPTGAKDANDLLLGRTAA
jgi:hypothetical protein